jgi:hypothetical protein
LRHDCPRCNDRQLGASSGDEIWIQLSNQKGQFNDGNACRSSVSAFLGRAAEHSRMTRRLGSASEIAGNNGEFPAEVSCRERGKRNPSRKLSFVHTRVGRKREESFRYVLSNPRTGKVGQAMHALNVVQMESRIRSELPFEEIVGKSGALLRAWERSRGSRQPTPPS